MKWVTREPPDRPDRLHLADGARTTIRAGATVAAGPSGRIYPLSLSRRAGSLVGTPPLIPRRWDLPC